MRLTTDTVQYIKASEGVYRASDVARAFEVHRSTVCRIWSGTIHSDVRPAPEPPNINTRPRPSELIEDIRMLLERGWKVQEVADYYGIDRSSVYACRGVFI